MANTRARMVLTKKDKKTKRDKKEPLAARHKEYLVLLSKAKKDKERSLLIDAANNQQIKAVSECIDNVIKGNVPITENQLRIIRRYKHVLRSLAKKCLSIKKKRNLLKQKGGFLGTLLPIGLNALGMLLPHLF